MRLTQAIDSYSHYLTRVWDVLVQAYGKSRENRLGVSGGEQGGRSSGVPDEYRGSPTTDVYECQLMLYTSVLVEVWSGNTIRAADAASVATQVVLACRLPGHSEPGGDLRPPDA